MTRYMGIAALTASLLAGAALPAFADVVTGTGTMSDPAKLSSYGASGSLAFPTTGLASFPKGAFTYDYYFQVDTRAMLTGVTSSASSTFNNIPNVNFTNYQIVGLFSRPLAGGPNQAYYPGLDVPASSYYFDANTTYHLVVSGNVTNGRGSFNGNLSVVSAVPLPTSVAMFGTALLGLGAFGAIRRKKASASAIA